MCPAALLFGHAARGDQRHPPLPGRRPRRERFQPREPAFRHGLRGPGRTGWGSLALAHIGADAVRAWAAARFIRAAAVLLLTGPAPKALDPRLPDRPRAERPVVAPPPGRSGCRLEAPAHRVDLVMVSFGGPASPVGHLAAEAARARALRDPRVADELTGDVEVHSSYVGGGRMLFWLVAETDEMGAAVVGPRAAPRVRARRGQPFRARSRSCSRRPSTSRTRTGPGSSVLFGENGAVLDIQADWYKSGSDLTAALDSRVPPSLRFPMSEGEPI
ncbi:hypothetical protein [Streptomyces sp. NPDC053431]|uniref:hypothetical protein n=1 Tax=Streptomyces sp. NPDC053431 TaxID=3365703 RepID=UPI0037D1342E